MEISVLLGWDVQRPVRGPNVAYGNYDHIYQCPDAEATETEELSNALLPVTQVEPEKNVFTVCKVHCVIFRPALLLNWNVRLLKFLK